MEDVCSGLFKISEVKGATRRCEPNMHLFNVSENNNYTCLVNRSCATQTHCG